MAQSEAGISKSKYAAKCPHCGRPHHYIEVLFSVENDLGYWLVECEFCSRAFVIELNNPLESGGRLHRQIRERHDTVFLGDRTIVASDVVKHNIDLNLNVWKFNRSAIPLYECSISSTNLETSALQALEDNFPDIERAYLSACNSLIKSGPQHDYVVTRIEVPCSCGTVHRATFYTRFELDPEKAPPAWDRFLLANVSGAQLDNTLDGLFSKSDVMDLLEKLVIRWNLLAEQTLIVAPFVGTTYMSSADQLMTWEWLLAILDTEKAVFLTRSASWMAYKSALERDGVSVELLERFGLENRLFATRNTKQDFHAKFFAGISHQACEVLSGSANLVRGPSIENSTFRILDRKEFDQRYTSRLHLKKQLPAPAPPSRHWVLIDRGPEGWRAGSKFNVPYV